jgi:hypothetical protein
MKYVPHELKGLGLGKHAVPRRSYPADRNPAAPVERRPGYLCGRAAAGGFLLMDIAPHAVCLGPPWLLPPCPQVDMALAAIARSCPAWRRAQH